MSAYIVDAAVIDAIVSLSVKGRDRFYYYVPSRQITRIADQCEADSLGSMLWAENLASVAARYPGDTSGTRPGPIGFQDTDVLTYEWPFASPVLTPLQGLAALHVYEYQSCEHPGWEASDAKAFVFALRHKLISLLPGFTDAMSVVVTLANPARKVSVPA